MRKILACDLVLAIFAIGMVPRVDAALSPSELLTNGTSTRSGDLESVRSVLENKLIRQRLQDLGYSADEISSRLAEIPDQELHKIAQKLDDLKVGGDGLGFVVAILLIILLVILILHFTGHRVLVK